VRKNLLHLLVVGLAGFQVADVVITSTLRFASEQRLDQLGVPTTVRALLPGVKILASGGLLAGFLHPLVGRCAALGLVGFYASAVGFHRLAGDRVHAALPAAGLGTVAAIGFIAGY
jgi:hypothetical protein